MEGQRQACGDYIVDVKSPLRLCRCGFPKSEHVAATQDKKRTLKPVRSLGSLAQPMQPPAQETTSVACEHFSIDLRSAQFGLCVCGYPKSAHKGIAKQISPKAQEKNGTELIRAAKESLFSDTCLPTPRSMASKASGKVSSALDRFELYSKQHQEHRQTEEALVTERRARKLIRSSINTCKEGEDAPTTEVCDIADAVTDESETSCDGSRIFFADQSPGSSTEESPVEAAEELAQREAREAAAKLEEERLLREAEEAERAEEEAKRTAAEALAKADEEAKRIAAEAEEEAKRTAAEALAKADEEAKKIAAEAEEEAMRTAAEAAQEFEEKLKKTAAEFEQKAQEEALRVAAEAAEEAKRVAAEDAKNAREEAERIAAEEEPKRLAAVAAHKAEEAKRIAAVAARKAEEEAKRIAEDEARRLAEEEARQAAAWTREAREAEELAHAERCAAEKLAAQRRAAEVKQAEYMRRKDEERSAAKMAEEQKALAEERKEAKDEEARKSLIARQLRMEQQEEKRLRKAREREEEALRLAESREQAAREAAARVAAKRTNSIECGCGSKLMVTQDEMKTLSRYIPDFAYRSAEELTEELPRLRMGAWMQGTRHLFAKAPAAPPARARCSSLPCGERPSSR